MNTKVKLFLFTFILIFGLTSCKNDKSKQSKNQVEAVGSSGELSQEETLLYLMDFFKTQTEYMRLVQTNSKDAVLEKFSKEKQEVFSSILDELAIAGAETKQQQSDESSDMLNRFEESMQMLRDISGDEFDRNLSKAVLDSHQKTIKLIKDNMLQNISNDKLKEIVKKKILPLLNDDVKQLKKFGNK